MCAIFKKYEKQYDFSSDVYMKEKSQNAYNRDGHGLTTNYFYDNFLKKFQTPIILIKYGKET